MIFYFSVVVLPFCLFAEIYTFPGEWEEKGSVKKLFDTPLGALYQFHDSRSYNLIAMPKPEHYGMCRCEICRKRRNPPRMEGGLLQFGFLKNSKKNQRFVAIDFKVRAFPALDRKEVSHFRFFLTRSKENKINADYGDLNGLARLISWPDGGFSFSTWHWEASQEKDPVRPDRLISSPEPFVLMPMFEPVVYRFIFDTEEGVVDLYQNGVFVFSRRCEIPVPKYSPIEIRNFGIITQGDGKSRHYREEYLEFSNPVVRMASSEKELMEDAPPVGFSPYPYGNYYSMVKNNKPDRLYREIRNHKNPDLQYAWAMRLLYGPEPDPGNALKLLERAAGEKHVPALYQLGVCHWRGYGVASDLEKAKQYLKKSAEYQYIPAQVLLWIVAWHEAEMPWIMDAHLWEGEKNILVEHDSLYLARLLQSGAGGGRSEAIFSPKFLMDITFTTQVKSSDPGKKGLRYVDYMIAGGYFPAHYELVKTVFYERNSTAEFDAEKASGILSHLEAGVSAGDPAALPAYFLFLAQNGQLTQAHFNELQELQYSDNPLYLFLKFSIEHPDEPEVRQMLSNFSSDLPNVPPEKETATGNLLRGLKLLFFRALMGNGVLSPENMENARRSFELLRQSAAENPIAQYWIGKCYYNGDLPENERRLGEYYSQGEAKKYFQAAAKGGMRRAEYMLLELEARNGRPETDQFLERLAPFCELGYAPAWMLRGRILRSVSRHDAAKEAFRKAVESGDHRGLRELALYAESEQRFVDAKQLWGEYIQADLRFRKFDRFDPYWPDVYGELGKWKFDPEGISDDSRDSVKMIAEGEN